MNLWRFILLVLGVIGDRATWFERVAADCEARGMMRTLPAMDAQGRDVPGTAFAHRYFVVQCRRLWFPFSIAIHHIVSSDPERFHTHEAEYLSWLLQGSYWEHALCGERALRRQGSVRFRGARTLHRVELRSKSVWSVFMLGPKSNVPGFLDDQGRHRRWDYFLYGHHKDTWDGLWPDLVHDVERRTAANCAKHCTPGVTS